jgi:hypothetical protein
MLLLFILYIFFIIYGKNGGKVDEQRGRRTNDERATLFGEHKII